MAHRDFLVSNGCVLLGIRSSKGIKVPTRTAVTRHLGEISSWQSEGSMFRVFCQMGASQLIYNIFALVITTKLTQKMHRETWDPSAPLNKLASQFEVVVFSGDAV